ncbi:MAG TPA: right-handed parallel beta-helix repeat-containing protein [Candidatus Avipropionibacterium avicola]|uniref:Right-handed parallel beta-helix repeat-containing protein n=1 Tax=Candidatus Avipropionibacterium avicola TaxID=2840701 RepID=A0A9D1KME9_9ACTN|nr:right-handed parallel beta-helix repeat-containing protein [Candidatus Avipropionibacterium avicola]
MTATPSRRSIIQTMAVAAVTVGGLGGRSPAQAAPHRTVVNVLDHGAAGDGQTDDSAAFQSAIDSIAEAGGGDLVVPARTYVIASAAADGCVVLRADDMTVRAEGATILRPDKFDNAVFVANTRSEEPLGYGAGVRGLRWIGGRFVGNLAESNFMCPFSLHHAQDCTFSGITFQDHIGRGSHVFDMVGADSIVIEGCSFLGQQTHPDDTENVGEAIQLGASYKGGLTGGSGNYGFSGLMCRDITVRDCEFLPFGDQAGPTPFGFHGGVEGKHHQRLSFVDNVVVDPRTSLTPDDSERDTVNRGAVHLSDAHGVTITGNRFTQTTGRVNRAVTIMGFDFGVLEGADPDKPTRGDFAAPQGPADIRIEDNVFEGFPARDGYDTVAVRGLDGAAVPGVVISNNTIRDGYASAATEHSAAIQLGNLEGPVISGNTIEDHHVGLDLTAGPISDAEVTGNEITNSTAPDAPAAIMVDSGLTDSVVRKTTTSGYDQAVAGEPGEGTVIED